MQVLAMLHKCEAEKVPKTLHKRVLLLNKREQITTELYNRTPEQYLLAWGAGVSGPQQSVVGNFFVGIVSKSNWDK